MLRAHFPEHSKPLLNDFKHLHIKLIALYHGISSEDELYLRRAQMSELHDRVTLPINSGGMSLRCMESTHLASFLASMVTSIQHLAKVFPSWLRLDRYRNFTSASDVHESYTSGQTMDVVDAFSQRAPRGPL